MMVKGFYTGCRKNVQHGNAFRRQGASVLRPAQPKPKGNQGFIEKRHRVKPNLFLKRPGTGY